MSFIQRRSPKILNPLGTPDLTPPPPAGNPPYQSVALAMSVVLSLIATDADAARLAKPNDQQQKIAPFTLAYGAEPPRYSIATRMLLAVTWPQDLEPRLGPPNERQQKIAPLTLAYGDQPPISGTSITSKAVGAATAWPADLEPRLSGPNNARVLAIPFTSGDQPSPRAPLEYNDRKSIDAWPQDAWPAQARPQTVTPSATDSPPVNGPLGARAISTLPDAWGAQRAPQSLAWASTRTDQPSVPFPYGIVTSAWADAPRCEARATRIAPLTLTYGDQPVPTSPLSQPKATAIASWPADAWTAQSAPLSLAWNVPPNSFPKPAFPYALILSTWPADLEPRLTRPNDQQQKIAPLTLTYGDQVSPLKDIQVRSAAAWIVTSDPPAAQKNAWNAPVIAAVPYTAAPRTIWTAWDASWVQPPKPVAIAPLTLPRGDSPPPVPMFAPVFQIIGRAWPLDLEPRLDSANITHGRVAPITLSYGQQPPRFTIERRLATVLASWPQDLEPRLCRPNDLRVGIAPLTLIYGQAPPCRSALPPAQLAAMLQWQDAPQTQSVSARIIIAQSLLAATAQLLVRCEPQDTSVRVPPDDVVVETPSGDWSVRS
jgi:hypothetical protein